MSLVENTQSKIVKRVGIITLILVGIFFLTFSEPLPYVYGIIFGATINVLNFRLLSLTVEKAVNMHPNKVMGYTVANYMVRYTIYGIVLTVAAMADYISFYTVVLGFFMVKIVILSDNFNDLIGKKKKPNSQ